MARTGSRESPSRTGRKLVGIITNRDLRFETNLEQKVADVMTKDNLVTVDEKGDQPGRIEEGTPPSTG